MSCTVLVLTGGKLGHGSSQEPTLELGAGIDSMIPEHPEIQPCSALSSHRQMMQGAAEGHSCGRGPLSCQRIAP